MSEVTIFSSKEFGKIRQVLMGGEPYFVAKDVAIMLGYKDLTNTINQHCKGVAKRYPLQTDGGIQEARVINEADMWRLIIKSKLETAQRIEKWVMEDVLPSIRKTGEYFVFKQPQVPQNYFEAVKTLVV